MKGIELSLNKPESFETAESFFGAISSFPFQSFLFLKKKQKRISSTIWARVSRFL